MNSDASPPWGSSENSYATFCDMHIHLGGVSAGDCCSKSEKPTNFCKFPKTVEKRV